MLQFFLLAATTYCTQTRTLRILLFLYHQLSLGRSHSESVDQILQQGVHGSVRRERERDIGARETIGGDDEQASAYWTVDRFVPATTSFVQAGEKPFEDADRAEGVAAISGVETDRTGPV
jgi:hypothetical protein